MCLDDCDGKLTRRRVLVGGAATVALAACGDAVSTAPRAPAQPAAPSSAKPTAGPVTPREVVLPGGGSGVLFRPPSEALSPVILVAHGNPGAAAEAEQRMLPYLKSHLAR
jgi:hypothetical protein